MLPILFGPMALTAEPVVSIIPLVIPRLVVFPLANVPYAFAGQFRFTLETVMPAPTRFATNVAVDTPGVTTN
jgi:hypothetical protein